MGSQQFCLKWNNHQMNLLTVFDQLLQNEAFVDVTIACDGQSLKAHKMVLSACSPYFQSLFIDNPCQHPIVILKDVRYDEIKCIIDFMYKGEVNVSQDQLSALLKTAETLKVKGLAEVTTSQNIVSHQSSSASSKPVSMESIRTGGSPPVKRKKKSQSSSASATAPASPNSNIAINNTSSFHRSSSVDHSNIQIPGSSFHMTPTAVPKPIASDDDGESLPAMPECEQEDAAGSSKLDLQMIKEERLDEPVDDVDDLIMEATPEHIEVEPSTGDAFNGCNQDQGSVAQLATTKYGNAYSPSMPSTSGTSSGYNLTDPSVRNLDPALSILDSENPLNTYNRATFVRTAYGHHLLDEGYRYSFHQLVASSRVTHWRCVFYWKSKCTGRCHVLSNQVIYRSRTHNHDPEGGRL